MSQLDEEYVTETYYPSPQKSLKAFLEKEKLISASVLRPDGQLCLETNLLEGFGKVVRYKKDGSRWFETFYQNGHKHGTEIKYHVNGQKWIETPWQNGKNTVCRLNMMKMVHHYLKHLGSPEKSMVIASGSEQMEVSLYTMYGKIIKELSPSGKLGSL